MSRKLIVQIAALALAVSPALPSARERLVLVPFQVLAHVGPAREAVMPAVAAALGARGYEVVSGDAVEDVLQGQRIRYLDSLTADQLAALLRATSADAAVLGTILDFSPKGDASVALRVEVSSPAGILWTRLFGLRISDTAGPFGTGRARGPEDLVGRALQRGLETLPPAGKLRRVYLRVPTEAAPHVYRAGDLPAGRPLICVLPIANRTEERQAGLVVEAALQHTLGQNPTVEVISPAEMRAAIVAGGIRTISRLAPGNVETLSKALGTSLFVQGTILRYDRATPEVEVYLSLTDLVSGRVLWSGLHRRRGADYLGWFRLTGIKDPALLAERVTAEMIAAFTRR